MQQALATVVIAFNAANAPAVDAILKEMGHPAERNVATALDAAGCIHFMSMSVVTAAGSPDAHLVLELTADVSRDEAFDIVAERLGPWLDRILREGGVRPVPSLAGTLRRHSLTLGQGLSAAFGRSGHAVGLPFSGSPDMSVRRILDERDLAAHVAADLAPILRRSAMPLQKLQAVRARLWSEYAQKWAFVPEPTPFLGPAPAMPSSSPTVMLALTAAPTFLWLLWPLLLGVLALFWILIGWLPALMRLGAGWLAFAGDVLGGLVAATVVTAILAIAAGVAAVLHLIQLESTDPTDDRTPDATEVAAFVRQEAVAAQNLLPTASPLKPGWFRRMTLRFAFRLIACESALANRPGFLGAMGDIHFARWMVLPRTDTLCFWSNYDGSWESYVETFIQQSGGGVNAIWSNTLGFPRTSLLFQKGCKDGNRLRRWARRQQFPVPFWYSAYPHLTLERIRLNAAIRQGIATIGTDADAADWLACFGAQPRPASVVERDEIPTLAFGGRHHLPHCACLILKMAGNQAACRAWLRTVAPEITYGHERLSAAAALAFAATGLCRLGLHEDDLKTFSPAFQNGMTSEGRSRALGDAGESDPARWLWGNDDNRADAVLVLYAEQATALDDLLDRHRRTALDSGQHVTHVLHAQQLPPRGLPKEPFGFLDGISNPVPAGLRDGRDRASAGQLVAAGEFVLGYPDNSDYLPPTPLVAGVRDPCHRLPDLAGDPNRQRPYFDVEGAPLQRDFGRNGTYLVVRQIAQDVDLFNAHVAEAAKRHGLPADRIAAKMVGRWRNGESLIRHPLAPSPPCLAASPGAASPPRGDNDFLFGRDDPQGLRCPLGAHIRRGNPRDSFDADSPDQLDVTNRHRILRVGRVYAPAAGEKPGLIFMCLNADIERQFEFVQQSWLLGRSFHGLEDEHDPMVGRAGGCGRFTIPTPEGPLRLAGLPAFTTIRGGGYFFMPGRRAMDYLGRQDS